MNVPSLDRVIVRSPGKVNLFLAVGELQDDGYHELASAFQALSLFEELTAIPSETFEISVTGDVDVSGVPLDDTNLALRAAKLLAERAGVGAGVHLHIHKGVPVAGGMGGGSADAAAALVACDALWNTGLHTNELHELAAELGADVPFALHGGTAIGVGRGDKLHPVLTRGRFEWVLAVAGEGLSTPVVYGELDRRRDAHRADLPIVPVLPRVDDEVLHALRAGDAARLAEALHNDLQAAAVALRPELKRVLEDGVAAGALIGIVSGSGPTIAFLCADAESALMVRDELQHAGYNALYAYGPASGTRVMSS